METIKEEEEIEQKNLGIREWTEEDDNKMGNIYNPYHNIRM